MFVFPAPLQIEAGSGHHPTIPYASEVGGLRLGRWEKIHLGMVIGSCCDESALDSDCCNIITGSSRCVNFQPQDPTKGRHFTYLEDPGTRFTRVLGFCVSFTFSWTVVRSSRLLIHTGCPSIVTFKRNYDFEKHRCLLFAGAVGMSFCDADFQCPKARCLWRQRHALWEWRGWREVFWCFATVASRGFSALFAGCMLHQHARTAIRRWMASAGPSEFLPAPGFWIFIFFGAIHFTRFRCSEKGFCVEPSWCPVEAMDGPQLAGGVLVQVCLNRC